MAQMVAFETAFIRTFRASAALASPQSSAFLYSCHNSCAGDSVLFSRVAVANQTMMNALNAWWNRKRNGGNRTNGGGQTDFSDPCLWSMAGDDRRCNPTCYTAG
jgi:hypothetical protein